MYIYIDNYIKSFFTTIISSLAIKSLCENKYSQLYANVRMSSNIGPGLERDKINFYSEPNIHNDIVLTAIQLLVIYTHNFINVNKTFTRWRYNHLIFVGHAPTKSAIGASNS